MKTLLLVFFGGGLGSSIRYLIGKHLNSDAHTFPWGTFAVNMVGSMIIGVVLGWVFHKSKLSNDMLLLVVAGFCGGFTTFSAFAHESFKMLQTGNTNLFLTYILSSIIFGLVCVWLGYITMKLI